MEAWNISIALLGQRAGQVTPEVHFFAAQTIKHKIVADFAQLEAPMIGSLRGILWQMVLGGEPVAGAGRAVRAQLILALAALIAQCPETAWAHPIEDLLAAAAQHGDAVLAVLAAIPEQLANPLIRMSSLTHAAQSQRLLARHVDGVVALVGRLLPAPASPREAVVACLLSWVKYGAAGLGVVGSDQLLALCLQTLVSSIAEDAGDIVVNMAELICELFYRLFQLSEAPPSDAYLAVLLQGLAQLKPHLAQLLKQEAEEEGGSESVAGSASNFASASHASILLESASHSGGGEERLSLTVGRVFLEAGEAFLQYLLPHNQQALGIILEAALMLVEQRHLKTVEATFSFWSCLEARLGSSSSEEARAPFVPVFGRLFRSLVILHLSFPREERWSAEERDAFRDFRHIIGDCLKDCTRVMGSSGALAIVAELLHETSAIADQQRQWQPIEAVLFALRTISSSVDRRESEMMPRIATMLLQLAQVSSPSSPKLIYAIILNVGCYSDWLRYHADFLVPFLSLLAAHLGEHASATAMALKYLCQSCAPLLIAHEGTLRSLYLQSTSGGATADTLAALGPREWQDLSEAVGNVLAQMPGETQSALLPLYLNPWIASLPTRPLEAIDNMAIFIELIPDGEAMSAFIAQLLPALSTTVLGAATVPSGAVLESVALLLKSIALNHAAVFAEPVVGLLDTLYVQHGAPSALYALRHLVMNDPPLVPWPRLMQSWQDAIGAAERGQPGIAELFQLSTAIIDYYPEDGVESLLRSGGLFAVLEMTRAVIAANPPTPSEVSAALLLLCRVVPRLSRLRGSAEAERLLAGVQETVQTSLASLIHCPQSCLGDVASLLRRYHAHDPAALYGVFGGFLQALPPGLLLPRERDKWQADLEAAMQSERPREAKDFAIALAATLKRRA